MVCLQTRRLALDAAVRRRNPEPASIDVEHLARDIVARHCHFRGRADYFQFVKRNDVLTVRGRVPSFYLKQMLQTLLKDLDGVRWIDNQVEVVACDGLSSVRDK
jgi:hypothetical protein